DGSTFAERPRQSYRFKSVTAASSRHCSQIENKRTWAQFRRLDATDGPCSNTRTGTLRRMRCAAAARPIGPAPITAIGKSLLICLSHDGSRIFELDGKKRDHAAADLQPLSSMQHSSVR